METGKEAATWLDAHLDDESGWDDGVPADAAPWVAEAFGPLVSLTGDQLVAEADRVLAGADDSAVGNAAHLELQTTDVAAGGSPSVEVDTWLTDSGFADDADLSFSIGEGDFGEGDLRASDLGEVEPLRQPLVDPFDRIEADDGGLDVAADPAGVADIVGRPVPADDIVAVPQSDGADGNGNIGLASMPPGGSQPDATAQPVTGVAAEHGAEADVHDLADEIGPDISSPVLDDLDLDLSHLSHLDDVGDVSDDDGVGTDDGWADDIAGHVDE